MIIAATGHRPSKLGGYDTHVNTALLDLARNYLARRRPVSVISGMALGWDQAFASAAVELGIPLTAAVPFAGQERFWPADAQSRYNQLLSGASVTIVSPCGYSPAKMQTRNEWLVDNCDTLAALWDGSLGGTANCIRYAERVKRPIENLWNDWTGGVFA